MKQQDRELGMDLRAAQEIVEAFSVSTGVSCRLLDAAGQALYAVAQEDVCEALPALLGPLAPACTGLHGCAAPEALRFGGRYIYFCPMGLAFFSSPIMDGGLLAGAMVAGPVRIMETEDLLASAGAEASAWENGDAAHAQALRAALERAPLRSPAQLSALSRQLFANAVYVSDSGRELLEAESGRQRSDAIADYISFLSSTEGERVPYPLDKEQELFRAVIRGDADSAGELLNQLLGHIYFYALDAGEIHSRIEELLVVLTRAAAIGGGNVEHILALSRKYLRELRHMHTQEDLTRWLAFSLRQLTAQVFHMADVKHAGAMQKAIGYMKRRYARKLTLEEVAEWVGYSPAYFSRIFREETGATFKEYLNALRIEQSKRLLRQEQLSIAEVSSMTGFSDQSYFCRIFRLVTGVTPDKYRKRGRRIDYGKEYGRS